MPRCANDLQTVSNRHSVGSSLDISHGSDWVEGLVLVRPTLPFWTNYWLSCLGLFIGSGAALARAGPLGTLLAYMITATIVWTVVGTLAAITSARR